MDFSLLPKELRQIAANSFHIEINGHCPGDTERYALIFHHATHTFETRRLKRGQSADIGDAMK